MSTTSNEVSERIEPSGFEVTLDALMRDVRTIVEQAEELERLAAAVVDNVTVDPEVGTATCLVTTSLIDDMATCLERIKANRVTVPQ